MIFYTSGGIWYFLKIFQMKGSVFPASFATAMPCGLIAAVLRWLINEGYIADLQAEDSILTQTQAWAGFSFLVGFLIVFRTSQAYSRFWDGCTSTHQMRAEWFDACSAIVSFCSHSSASQESIMYFKHTLIRLFSMLHASALADLEDLNNTGKEDDVTAFTYELIDPAGIDEESLETMRVSEARVELIFEWIQLLIVKNISTGVLSIPPPILSRAFQEIANGMVAFHDSVKISYIPFPFPYAQNCDFLLLLHWCLAPFIFTQWVTEPMWAFVFVFSQVFVLWSLNFIAVEIENPFGNDKNDLDGHHMQCEMNRHLLLLLKPSTMRMPSLSQKAIWSTDPSFEISPKMVSNRVSFVDIWARRQSNGSVEASIARKEPSHVRARRASLMSGPDDGAKSGLDSTGFHSGNGVDSRKLSMEGNGNGNGNGNGDGNGKATEDSMLEMDTEKVLHPPALHGPWETLPKAPWPRDARKAPDVATGEFIPADREISHTSSRPPAPANPPADSPEGGRRGSNDESRGAQDNGPLDPQEIAVRGINPRRTKEVPHEPDLLFSSPPPTRVS